MPDPRQSVRVQIFNQTYSLLTEGNPREVEEIASQVDELMTSIAGRTSSGDAVRVAVLACIHMADRLRAAERRLEQYQNESEKIAGLLDKALSDTSE